MNFIEKVKALFGGQAVGGNMAQLPVAGQQLSSINSNTGKPVSTVRAEPGSIGERMLPAERISTRRSVDRRAL